MIEYTVAANISINIQEIGFINKLIDLLVFCGLDKARKLIIFVRLCDI